jgi:hypothetical protein
MARRSPSPGTSTKATPVSTHHLAPTAAALAMALPSLVPGTALLLAPAPATALLHVLLLALPRALAVASTLLPTELKPKVPTPMPVLSPLFPLLRPEALKATAAGTCTMGAQHQLSVLRDERLRLRLVQLRAMDERRPNNSLYHHGHDKSIFRPRAKHLFSNSHVK